MKTKLFRFLKKTAFVLVLMIGSVGAGIIVWGSLFYFLEREKDLTNRKVIGKMTGVILPEYKVIDSKVNHLSSFDYEETTSTDIEFLEMPDQNFFKLLDQKVKVDLEGSGKLEGEWSKKDDEYTYSLMPMGARSDFVKEDGFFFLYINKNSKKGHIRHGNY